MNMIVLTLLIAAVQISYGIPLVGLAGKDHDHPSCKGNCVFPVLGNEFSIPHVSSKDITFCTVKEPFGGKDLHFSNPPDSEYPDVSSADQGRVILDNSTKTVCKAVVTNAQMKDDGVWQFTIGTGRNRRYKEESFNYTIHVNGTSSDTSCKNKADWCETVVKNVDPTCKTDHVKENCEKQCNMCPPSPPPSDVTCVNNDTESNCDGWKGRGFCKGEHAAYMKIYCKKSCRLCKEEPEGLSAGFVFEEKNPNDPPRPPRSLEIEKVTVKIGNDGTDDKMSIKVCSDVDRTKCCTATLLEDFVAEQTKTWGATIFDRDCRNEPLQILKVPWISITKFGIDNLAIKGIDFFMTKNQDQTSFSCNGFKLLGNCVGDGCAFKYENEFECTEN